MNNELLLEEQLEKLREKYENMGQDMNSYLDGLTALQLPAVLGLCAVGYADVTSAAEDRFS